MKNKKMVTDELVQCMKCGRYDKFNHYCMRYKSEISDPYIDTKCKFYTENHIAGHSVKRPFDNTEFRSEKGYEKIGGLIHTHPYWNKKHNKKKKNKGKKKC